MTQRSAPTDARQWWGADLCAAIPSRSDEFATIASAGRVPGWHHSRLAGIFEAVPRWRD